MGAIAGWRNSGERVSIKRKQKALRPYGRALGAYESGDVSASIMLHTSLGEYDSLPISIFFRDRDGFMPFEAAAMDHCRGRVLDAGAGTGVHSLVLQERGLDVTAIDIVPEAARHSA